MLKLSYDDLKPHILKSGIIRAPYEETENTITITHTTQGANTDPGINLTIRIARFLDFGFFEVIALGNRLYFRPTQFKNNTHKLSINGSSRYPVGKIDKGELVKILKPFEGTWQATMCQIDNYTMFYIEKE